MRNNNNSKNNLKGYKKKKILRNKKARGLAYAYVAFSKKKISLIFSSMSVETCTQRSFLPLPTIVCVRVTSKGRHRYTTERSRTKQIVKNRVGKRLGERIFREKYCY